MAGEHFDDDRTSPLIDPSQTPKVSHYVLVSKIGSGGMGEVYLAEDIDLNRKVALKFLSSDLCQDADCRARFKREAQAAAKLNHPNIVTIHEVSEFNGRPYFVMEYVEGQSLRELIKGKELPIDRVIDLAIQICEGLHKAHQSGVVHRDVKPANILIDANGRAKILDFGLATVQGCDHLTKTGSTLGTVGYMSPEQVRGERVDQRSDIFSLGVVLYELLTGHSPFKADTEAATLHAITSTKPELLARFRREIPPGLQTIIDKALDRDATTRYQHADELAADLRSIQGKGQSHGVAPDSSTPVSPKRRALYAVMVLALLVIGYFLTKALVFSPTEEPMDSLAVLPLENLSGDPGQEYFSDGMTDELITELQKIKSLRVISRTSVMRYKKTEESLPEIARALHVKGVVEGSVLREGDVVRINVQLIQASPEKHLWASDYDRPMRSVLALQSDVAQAIAKEVKAIVTPEEQKQMAAARQLDPEAHEAYLMGLFFWNKRRAEDLKTAVDYFNKAIAREPTYAMAYVGLASTYAVLPIYSVLPADDCYPKAIIAARKALELDSTLGEAYAVLAGIESDEWDWNQAEIDFKRALELNPGYATTHHWYRELLLSTGRLDEAFAEIRRAREIDPASMIINVNVGATLYYLRQYDKAVDQYKRVLELGPSFPSVYPYLGAVYLMQGKVDDAIAVYRKSPFSDPNDSAMLGYACTLVGNVRQAKEILTELLKQSKRRTHVPTGIAILYMGLGNKDKAFEWLETAYEVRDMDLRNIKVDPIWDALRPDPRFKALVKKMGLEP